MLDQQVPALMLIDTRTPKQTVTIKTTAEQDKKIQDFYDALAKNPGYYELTSRNCATTVEDALKAAGIDVPRTIFPKDLMRYLQKQFGSQGK